MAGELEGDIKVTRDMDGLRWWEMQRWRWRVPLQGTVYPAMIDKDCGM